MRIGSVGSVKKMWKRKVNLAWKFSLFLTPKIPDPLVETKVLVKVHQGGVVKGCWLGKSGSWLIA